MIMSKMKDFLCRSVEAIRSRALAQYVYFISKQFEEKVGEHDEEIAFCCDGLTDLLGYVHMHFAALPTCSCSRCRKPLEGNLCIRI